MTLSGIHDFRWLQSGFPIKITSGMTICESIKIVLFYPIAYPGGKVYKQNIKHHFIKDINGK